MRQREPLALGPGREQELPGTAGDAERERRHVARNEPHDVADREHRRHRAAGRVDPQRDVRVLVLVGQREELGGEQGAVVVVEHPVEDEHPPLQQLSRNRSVKTGIFASCDMAPGCAKTGRMRGGSLPSADLPTAARQAGYGADRFSRCPRIRLRASRKVAAQWRRRVRTRRRIDRIRRLASRGADGRGAHDGVLQALDVVRVDDERAAELVGRAGELAQHQRAALVVAAGDVLLGHQVHPVPQRGHQHHVGGQVQRGHLLPRVGLVQVVHGRAADLARGRR